MSRDNPQYIANDDINVSRFVTPVLTADYRVVEADANSTIVGISQGGARDTPLPSASTLAAASGDQLQVHGDGEICRLLLGGTVAHGDDLKSDSDGKGVVIAAGTTTQEIGAKALEAGSSGDLILVQVRLRSEGQTAISS